MYCTSIASRVKSIIGEVVSTFKKYLHFRQDGKKMYSEEIRYGYILQEAQLPQRHCATRYVSKFVLCFKKYKSYKGFKQQKWRSRLLMFIGNGAI